MQEEEKTEIVYGTENTISVSLDSFARAKQNYDSCGDFTLPSVIMTTEPIRNAYIKHLKRGIKTRFITEISEKNVVYCKELMKIVYELRHLEGVKGNFGVSEFDYIATAIQQEGQPIPQLIHSNARMMIEQQQYFFQTLWDKAMPAQIRIREVEEGIKPEVIETIKEPKATQERTLELIKSANEEILVIFSTSNVFRRQEKAGAVGLLVRIAKSKNVKVRIMSPFDEYLINKIKKIKRDDKIRIEIRNLDEPLQTKVSVMIVDRASLLSAELKSDSKETSLEAMGLATYSNSKATVLSYASIFESLWNQTRLYEDTKQLYQQLKSHDRMQKEFIDIAAHELRTPIQPILGLAQILKDQISDSTQTKFLDVILRNAKRLEQLQGDMLDVTRIEGGSMKIYNESFDLNELISHVIQDFSTQLKNDPQIKLNYKNGGDIWVTADKNRIIQVISNLLANAIKFTKSGRILVHLRIRKSKKMAENNQVIVSVKDEGPGIDPLIMPRLFTKFASKSDKGIGLGLYISKSIIEAHGGRIWATNNRLTQKKRGGSGTGGRGGGATFSFSLPVKLPLR